jgi:hypothetical protein
MRVSLAAARCEKSRFFLFFNGRIVASAVGAVAFSVSIEQESPTVFVG